MLETEPLKVTRNITLTLQRKLEGQLSHSFAYEGQIIDDAQV